MSYDPATAYIIRHFNEYPLVIPGASSTAAGVMSATDKAKLDAIPFGGTGSLHGVYANGTSQPDNTINIDTYSVLIRDNMVPLAQPLFAVQNATGSTSYVSVSSSTIALGNASAVLGSASSPLVVAAPIADDLGPFTHILTVGSVEDGTWLKIKAGDDPAYADFYGTFASFANPVFRDDVWRMGFGVAKGSGSRIPGRGALYYSLESHFDGGHRQMEGHHNFNYIDGTETRYISFEGHLDAPSTALYLASTTISLASGNNSNDDPSLQINPTTTVLSSPGGFQFVTLDTAGEAITIANGVSGDVARAQITMSNSGSVVIFTKQAGAASGIGRLSSSAASPNFEWDDTLTRMLSPSGQSQVRVVDEQVEMYANGLPVMFVQATQVSLGKLLSAEKAAVGTNTRGDQIAAMLIRNATAATGGAQQQYSPSVVLTGFGWDSDGGVSVSSSFETQVQPQAGTIVSGRYAWLYSSDQANFSAVAYLDSNGRFSTALFVGGPTALSIGAGGGAIPITHDLVELTTTAAGALTLDNGTAGQHLRIVHVADGGDGTLAPTTKIGFNTIVFTAVGNAVHLIYTSAGWAIVGSFGVTIA